jgi:DNA repair exonuclease SbcCD ATPase subunit
MARKDIDKRIEQAAASTTKLINEMQKLRSEGAKSAEDLKQVADNAKQLIENFAKLSASVKRSLSQTKDQGQFDKDVKAVEQATAKVNRIRREAEKKYTQLTEVEAKKREQNIAELEERSIRKFKRNVERKAKAEQTTRNKITASNKRNTQRVTEFEKRQLDRRAAYYAKKEREKTNAAKKEQKKRQDQEKRNDFGGGFGAQFTPRAIGGALGSLGKYLGLYQALNVATQLFKELTVGSVKQAIEFERQLANLGAVAGASSEEVKRLGKEALATAGSTKFTAQEIVTLQTELSKLGFSAEDVISATQDIAFAAQALGAPLDKMAEQIGKIINQFNLLVEETSYVGDVLVTTINNSALSVDSFATAMQYVGPIARTLGLDLQQTAGAMAVLADNGFTASRIGTGLRGILTEIGKTSADAEKTLRDLAEQNISLSEAVELVGKRNAAQLLTLLRNIDAIDQGNERYYEQGKALISAAQQADTFSGQMDILTSNLREFQINLGNAIVDSNFFISVLGLLSDKAQRTALGFKALRDVGLKDFQSDVKSAIDSGVDPMIVALDRMIEQGTINTKNLHQLKRAFTNAAIESERLGIKLQPTIEKLKEIGVTEEQYAMLQGYFDLLEDGIETQREQNAITKGQTEASNVFEAEIDALLEKQQEGLNVNEEANKLYRELQAGIESYERALKSASGVTEEQRIEYEASIKALQGYQEQVNNTIISEEELERRRKKRAQDRARKRKKQFKEEVDAIKQKTKEEIDAINERARVETALATHAEQRADIEAERQQLVSTLYNEEATAISNLSSKYGEFTTEIEKLAKKSKESGRILTSEVIEDVKKAAADYANEIKQLEQDLESGKISPEEYLLRRELMFEGFQSNVEAFKAQLEEVSPEIAELFQRIMDETLNADYAIFNPTAEYDAAMAEQAEETAKKAAKEAEETAKKLKDQWVQALQQITDAVGQIVTAYNATNLENTRNSLKAELDAIKERYRVEEEILKSNLNNKFISESQYRAKSEELKKKQLQKENDINREIFDAQKKADLVNIGAETIQAIASNAIQNYSKSDTVTASIQTAIGYGSIVAAGAAKADAVRRRKFFDVKYEEGGLVEGPSHAQGGVPFTVQGQGGYEMEGGEFIVNKKAASLHRSLLEGINNSVKPNVSVEPMRFATGGMVNQNITNVNGSGQESVNYLKAIAEATTSTAIQSSKPVRAFISDKDLRTNETERRLRERNDRI